VARDEAIAKETKETRGISTNYKAPSIKDLDKEEDTSFHDTKATPFSLDN